MQFHSSAFPGTLQWSTSMDMDKLWEGWRTWSYEVERTSIPGSILLSSMYNVKLSAETFQNKNRQNSFNQHQKHLPFKFSTRLVQWSPKNKLENGPTVDWPNCPPGTNLPRTVITMLIDFDDREVEEFLHTHPDVSEAQVRLWCDSMSWNISVFIGPRYTWGPIYESESI